ncbi:uncharacterized protein TrAtP1_007886 [Trichoderma atroviride]|uniref:Uncharacterized protein n=1 Tax=Hypocrea atroviridis (strain ATCC 20476 / IMI 206040) TaxID=452589 RepID=G9NHB9_HYPAI|nr:uncharacterized protein TRIATDRAFT_51090 [Trichoderma atroviride IMI 206040]EHK50013.1 hypothetical protein TRIATDRAFT_51090 [Trichoderma atroviride IMI 206040]UKZ66715.1 hypothetical protein TrAtP1_007886 [Trichoderma atroviride]
MGASITPPDLSGLLAPILPALPTATASTEPAAGILPLLSPILRQRVKLFSAGSTEPWLRLLSYDTAKAAQLTELVQNGSLEPHPVSGEVEVDWDYDVETRYKRLDQETLHALTVLVGVGLAFQLVYCVNDAEGGSDGWRIGEVTAADKAAPFAQFGGVATLAEAEAKFQQPRISEPSVVSSNGSTTSGSDHMEEDDDDGYWDRYDATPARTPAVNRSPAPQAAAGASAPTSAPSHWSAYDASAAMDDDDDDDYYAQYDSVQPAMDNHDPDEEAMVRAHIQPPLGLSRSNDSVVITDASEPQNPWSYTETNNNQSQDDELLSARELALLHPRPRSSASSSSNGSMTVAKLEASAVKQEQNDFGVKQHVSRSIRSLFLLARSSGIEREEFEQLVKREMDVLSLMEDQE